MNALKLLEILTKYQERHGDLQDKEVVVQTANRGIPHNLVSAVKNACMGFDWTQNFFIIQPTNNLVIENKLAISIRDYAKLRLEQLKEAHEKLGFKYLSSKKAEQDWMDGFVEALRQQVTSLKDNGNEQKEE